jgi:hypothetical protein
MVDRGRGLKERIAQTLRYAAPCGVLLLLSVPEVQWNLGDAAYAGKSAAYAGQNVVDSLVDRAFYVLNSVDDPASGISQEEAIAAAKGIDAKLRSIAQNDPNQKYILWKAGELEAQIYLEEKGLLLEKEQWKQKSYNDLVPQFNAALGKPRPNFRELWNIYGHMASIDPDQAIDAENSIKKRAFALAAEVPAAMELALEKKAVDSARAELVYCQVNREYLGFSPSRYAGIEAKFAAAITIEDERLFVARGFQRFREALVRNNLIVAKRENQFIGEKVRSLRSQMVSFEWSRINKDYELLASKLERKEDSLVSVAMALLRGSGPSAADAFLDTMKARGVGVEKVSRMDRLILESVIAQKQQQSANEQEVVPEAVRDDTAGGRFELNALLESARRNAAEKNDSVAAQRASRSTITQVEEVRKNRLRVAYDLRKMREEKQRITEKEVALQELVDIYTSIELHKPKEAKVRFVKSKELLKKNLPQEDFNKVTILVEKL